MPNTELYLFRVDLSGQVVATNTRAAAWLAEVPSRRCRDVLAATDEQGAPVCSESCITRLAGSATGATSDEERAPRRIRGQLALLHCELVGSEILVVARVRVERSHGRSEQLTTREREILALVAEGLTSAQIAGRLGLSRSTVRTHMEHVRQRLGVKTRAEAVRRALCTGQL